MGLTIIVDIIINDIEIIGIFLIFMYNDKYFIGYLINIDTRWANIRKSPLYFLKYFNFLKKLD